MVSTAGRMLTFKNAKVMPTASASMLVATAMANMTRKPREALASSVSPFRASRSMLIPRIASRAKAIQWSMAVMYRENREPRSQPSKGMSPWNPPNHSPTRTILPKVTRSMASPLQIETASASMDSPTAKSISSKNPILFRPPGSQYASGAGGRPDHPRGRDIGYFSRVSQALSRKLSS